MNNEVKPKIQDMIDPQKNSLPEEFPDGDLMTDKELSPGFWYYGNFPGLEDAVADKKSAKNTITTTEVDLKKARSPDAEDQSLAGTEKVEEYPTPNPATGDGDAILPVPSVSQAITERQEITPGAYLFEHGTFRTAAEANTNNLDGFDCGDNHDHQRTHASEQLATSRNFLAVANSVEEVDPHSLQQARPSTARNATRERMDKHWVAICTFSGLVSMGVLVLLIVFLVSDTHQSGATNQPTVVPSMAPTSLEPSLLSLLPDHTIKAVEDKESPQYKALEWLLDDPHVYEYPDWRIRQRHALMTVFYATAGPTKWLNNTGWGSYSMHECEWFQNQEYGLKTILQNLYPGYLSGFLEPMPHNKCDNQGLYQHLWLDSNNLVGSLAEEVFSLTSLQSMSAGVNKLHGTISTYIGQLSDLKGISIVSAELSGSMPKEMGDLPSLEIIFLFDNKLQGSVPDEIWHLPNIDTISIGRNANLQGSIPSIVGNLQKLRHLVIDGLDFSGTLPTELGQATSLEWLVSVGNRITGTLPSELGNLSRLWMMAAYGLQGSVPTELANLSSSLYILDLRWGSHTGTVPSELGLLPLLHFLGLSSNQLSGTIPNELSHLSNLRHLRLGDNFFSGGIPSEIGMLTSLEWFSLRNNSISGTVPEELASLGESLYTFHIEGNPLLFGSIPDSLCVINGTCDFKWFEQCIGPSGRMFDCTEQLCGCDCSC
ncbi:LRR receptor-like serine threonine-protein kinase [Seminavis robusta]|uniref:LRR receptor-like serine threonine-protein kinase n=1 Tax=Seminavis robusta TaxID=568900 RepID=A0A9N8DQI0_9STRA|nr:LRR receptor-like serine threonine-protein kinase [Seminavis robusta]|eukprot:Sro275_g105630.1 LRR receptor-like serine threonine-protein kinase (712) ;mRNA; f:12056-14279